MKCANMLKIAYEFGDVRVSKERWMLLNAWGNSTTTAAFRLVNSAIIHPRIVLLARGKSPPIPLFKKLINWRKYEFSTIANANWQQTS